MKIVPVNGSDRDWTQHRYILWFGACAPTRLMVWANHLQDALDESIDWIVDNAPGLLCDVEINEAYNEAIAAGKSEDDAWDIATQDTTCGGNGGHNITNDWGILAEDPTRAEIKKLQAN